MSGDTLQTVAERVRVPVIIDWDHERVVGFLEVDVSALPKNPDFCFALGFRTRNYSTVMTDVDAWDLISICPVSDEEYAEYLGEQELARLALAGEEADHVR